MTKQVDYIVVGLGLAGIAFCEQLEANNKSFVVFDKGGNTSSEVAGGMYNPVVLKRFTPTWKADEQLQIALPFYQKLEKKLNTAFIYEKPVHRIFDSVGEQNEWFEASDKPLLSPYLNTDILQNSYKALKAPFGLGKVNQSGWIDTSVLLAEYRKYLKQTSRLFQETFDYEALHFDSKVLYNNFSAEKIVFAEGFGIKKNPLFKHLPLVGNKGELLTVKAPDLQLDIIVKAGVFIIPIGNDCYRIGATYHWTDKTSTPTEAAKTELFEKLQKIINCDVEILAHNAGVRPTVSDRKPLLGSHHLYRNASVFNGLGTRGVLIAPYAAPILYEHLTTQKPIPEEISIERF
jgi:glycine oxidase